MSDFDTLEQEVLKSMRPVRPCPPLAMLFAYGEGVLPDDAAADIGQHLEDCGLCRTLITEKEHLTPPGLSELECRLMRNKLPEPPAPSNKTWRWYAASVAVAAALLLAIFIPRHASVQPASIAQSAQPGPVQPPLSKPEVQKPVEQPVEQKIEIAKLVPPLELAPELVLRGAIPVDQPTPADLAPAFDAYSRSDYSVAADRFRLLAKRFPMADVPLLYLGVTQLMTDDNRDALVSLSRADMLARGEQKDAASWYHAVAAVETHSSDAPKLLDDLCRRNHSQYAHQACALKSRS
jgi:hypothetical protein